LGLLPSGPDPVGEEHVRANLPIRYMRIYAGGCKRVRLLQSLRILERLRRQLQWLPLGEVKGGDEGSIFLTGIDVRNGRRAAK
jgi:hypothetical protein